MAINSYFGFAYKQNKNSPELFAFVGSADELKKICGVARKDEHHLTNYQRALDKDRLDKEVIPFFRSPTNCSPTAIVISLQETPICKIKYEDYIPAGTSEKLPFPLRKLTIDYINPEEMPREKVIDLMKAFLDRRLQDDSTTGASSMDADDSSESATQPPDDVPAEGDPDRNDDANGSAANETDEGEPDDKIEIGTSMLRALREQLDCPDQINPDMLAAFHDMLKPALVIDGQHRLFGSAAVEEDIPFLVCALVEPEWKEQVFQFTVINDKAKGIPRPFITSLAGMSLTSAELDALRERLRQAGIQLWEVEVMQRIGFDSSSPFRDMIDFRVNQKAASGVAGLGYQTMKALGRAWYEGNNAAAVLLKLVDKIHRESGKSRRISKRVLQQYLQHEPGYWFELYKMFWSKVRGKFEPEGMWKIGSGSFMTAVVLLQFQTVFLTQLSANYDLTIGEVTGGSIEERQTKVLAEYAKVIDNFLKKFSAKHFDKPFRGALNQQDGKDDLVDYFSKIFAGQSVAKHHVLKKTAEGK